MTCHNREVQFYNDFVQKSNFTAVPVVYAAESYVDESREGAILMEDLSVDGVLQSVFLPFNLRQVTNNLLMTSNFC